MIVAPEILRADPWLSEMLNCPAFHISGANIHLKENHLPPPPAFIDGKVLVDDAVGLRHLQERGLRVVSTAVQLRRAASPISGGPFRTRFSNANDEEAVRRIARESFKHDRFHNDSAISTETADRIKENWAGNFFAGQRGDLMVVSEENDIVCGFLQLMRKPKATVVIDLIAVTANSRGRGAARSMIAFATRACQEQPVEFVVGTQLANIQSLCLYLEMGFKMTSAAYQLHLHRSVA